MNVTLYPKLILDALVHVRYPGTGKDIVSTGMVQDNIRIEGNKVSFSLIFDKPNDPFAKSVVKAAEQAILTYVGEDVDIKGNITVESKEAPKPKVSAVLPGVKNIIAVFSGKGGVGKSTVSSNLAIALAKLGYKVGLLDADIHGPSMPKMFGVEDARPMTDVIDGKQGLIPVEKYGVKILSIGFFVDPENALVWRGSMASNALKQLITDAHWGELDFFVMDLPPGTGDIQLNNKPLISGVSYLIDTGSIIKVPDNNHVYFREIESTLFAQPGNSAIIFHAESLNFRFKGSQNGIRDFSFWEESGQVIGVM